MSILLVGQHTAFADLSNVLTRLADVKITHCVDGKQAIAELQCDLAPYTWILIEANEEPPAQLYQLVERIRALDIDTPISFIAHQVDKLAQNLCPPAHVCRVMNDANGEQRLHCALHAFHQASQDGAPPRISKHNLDDIFVFEYHAPAKKTA